jgi:hypothetical protein
MRRRADLERVATAGLCVAMASCGAILGIDDGIPRDGGGDATPDVSIPDAAPDAPARCSVQTPFATPVAVAALDTGSDEALAHLSRDELEVYFERIGTSYDLFVATRLSAAQPFDPPVPVATVNTASNEADPALSVDGQLLYFVSDRTGGAGGFDLWAAPRVDGGFGTATVLSAVSSPSNEQYPYALANSLYFTSDRTGTAAIYRADLAGTSATNPTLLGAADAGAQLAPVVSDDELVMYFAAAGVSDASNDFDIWLSTRTATSQPWSAPVQVSELDTPSAEVPSWLSPDLCRLYLSTNRGGNFDIYVATRSP